jgi:hypothetical protein
VRKAGFEPAESLPSEGSAFTEFDHFRMVPPISLELIHYYDLNVAPLPIGVRRHKNGEPGGIRTLAILVLQTSALPLRHQLMVRVKGVEPILDGF